MRIVLTLILIFHGLLHFLGFAKTFDLGNLAQFSKEISKPTGLFWFLTGVLFVVSAILYFRKREVWQTVAILAVVLSQVLILMFWEDARYGTILNIILLAVSISAYSNYRFNKMVLQETQELVRRIGLEDTSVINKDDMEQLPEIVQKWMQNSGMVGKEKMISLGLKQKGEMKTKPEGKWMPFTAAQYFDIENPAFVWSTEVDFISTIKMVGRDKWIDGQGEMLIKLAALVPVVDEGNNEKINSGAMVRYMAEMVWFPSAALNDYINWELVDANSAKAIFTWNGKAVSGIYRFSEEGNFKSFEADRYYGGKNNSKLEKWKVTALSHKKINGVSIPNSCRVTWKLEEGDFNWLNLEITALEYNITQPLGQNDL